MKHLIAFLVFCMGYTVCYSQDYARLKKELADIHRSDQVYRVILDSLVRKARLDWQHPEIQKIIPIAARQDSVNLARVMEMINQYGWLGTQQVGKAGNETLFVVIQHADSGIIAKYFPLLVKSYETGGTPGKYYAMMLDRILVDGGHKQLFGTQIQMETKEGKFLPFPIEDEKKVDLYRKKVGLKPLKVYLAEVNK